MQNESVCLLSNLSSRSDVAVLLNTTDKQLRFLLYGLPDNKRYYTFKIPKKSGGNRIIEAPRFELKYLQNKLYKILSEIYNPRVGVHGFRKGRSIVSNASKHCCKRYIFNIDLKDFFPSIHIGRVIGLFQSNAFGIKREAAIVLAQICCHKGSLPQGAPTSPIISNMICYRLDRQLMALAHEYNCVYTRYADDITFSKKRGTFPSEIGYTDEQGISHIADKLRNIIEEDNYFRINTKKVRLSTNYNRQTVTGLTVNTKKNVDRRFIRQIRAMIHSWSKDGFKVANKKHATIYYRRQGKIGGAPSIDLVIHGKLDFVKMVKGANDPVYKNLQTQYVRINKKYLKVMAKENKLMKSRDFFIVHASEDKDEIAKPLAVKIIASGHTVWFDEYEIMVGDSLRSKIDDGLVHSKFGIVILSKHLFNKKWPQRELDGLTALEDDGKNKILPVWHNVRSADVVNYSPTIAGLKALASDKYTIDQMVKEFLKVLKVHNH